MAPPAGAGPLAELHDILVPPPAVAPLWIYWLPLVSAVLTLCAVLLWRREQLYPWRLETLVRLRQLRALSPRQRSLPLHRLLRQLAMANAPGAGRLTGKAWADTLNRILHTRYFSEDRGAAVLGSLYRAHTPVVDDDVLLALERIVRKRTRWPW